MPYYAVKEDETPEGEGPKYPIENCSDVEDAWMLRSHGDYTISTETLEERIQDRARTLGCDVPGTEQDE